MNIRDKLHFYEDKTVSITGSSGLLGSHLLDILGSLCKETRILVRKPIANNENRNKIIRGDVRKSTDLDKIVKDADVIFHLAAVVNVDSSIKNPLDTLNTNVLGTMNLLESIRKEEKKPLLVFSSSIAVYGVPRTNIITENHTMAPSNPYSASKAAADIICQAYNKTYDIPITILRLSTLYGPRQRTTQFIPAVILQCLSSDAIQLGSLNAYRDFCYVKDATTAFLLAGANTNARGQVLNISTGVPTKIADVVTKVSKILGKDVKIKTKDAFYRPEETANPFIIDPSRARKILGWIPCYTIDSGLKETIEWFAGLKTA